MRFVFALVAALLVQGAVAQPPARPVRVLFIGNAMIATSDLPRRIAKVAEANARTVVTETLAPGEYSLEDHWREGTAAQALRTGWDIVVLQQDAPAAAETARFVSDVKRFAGAIRAAGAQPALFMAWPRGDRLRELPEAIRAHRTAAEAAGATLVPAAESWLRALGADRRLRLHAGPGTQPSALGADLAVLTTYLALFPAQEFDEAFVERTARALGTPTATRDVLFDAATRAIDEPMSLGKAHSP